MRKTYTLHLKNFRSIRDAKIDFAPLTVVYGPEWFREVISHLWPPDPPELSDKS